MGENRQANREQAPTGSCLVLWNRRDMREATWATRVAAATARRRPADAPPPRPVTISHDRDYAEFICGVAADRRREQISANPRLEVQDPVLKSWVTMVSDKLGDLPLVFFTGTYSDAYGMSHGLMLPRNVQADFKRALRDAGLADRRYINAVEPHRLRSVLHCHALIEASEADAAVLQAVWDKRGWSSAPRCTDGGVSYCCKYALKSASADAFDWRF